MPVHILELLLIKSVYNQIYWYFICLFVNWTYLLIENVGFIIYGGCALNDLYAKTKHLTHTNTSFIQISIEFSIVVCQADCPNKSSKQKLNFQRIVIYLIFEK